MKAIRKPFATLKKDLKHRLGAKKRASTVDETMLAAIYNNEQQEKGEKGGKKPPIRRGTYACPDNEIALGSESSRT